MESILQPVGGSRRPIEPHSLHAPNAAPRSDAREIVAVARGRLHGHFASYQKKTHAGLLNANSFAQSGVCSGRRQRPARRQRHGISHDPSPDARRQTLPWAVSLERRPPEAGLHISRQRVATATGRGGRLSLTHFMPPRSLLAAPRSCARELASCHGHTTQQFSLSWPWPTTVKPPEAGSMITLHLTRFRIYPTPICAPLALHKAGPLL